MSPQNIGIIMQSLKSSSKCQNDSLDDIDEPKTFDSKCRHFIGILLAALLGQCYTLMGFVVKYLKTRSPIDMSFMFSSGCVIFALPLVITSGSFKAVDRKFFVLVPIFGVLMALASNTRYNALKMLPLGEASAIIFSSPIFTAILTRFVLKEKSSRTVNFSLLVSFIGLLLVAKIPKTIEDAMDENSSRLGSSEHLAGCAYAFAAVFISCLISIMGRKLRYVNNWTLTCCQGIFGAIFVAAISPAYSGLSFQGDCSYKSWIFAAVGVYGFVINCLFVTSLKYEDPVVVTSIMLSTDIVSSFLVQVFFFDDPIDAYSCSGAILVFLSGMVLPFRKWVIFSPKESQIKRTFRWID